MEYDVFISHSHEDSEIAEKLYSFLVENGYRPWLDKHDIKPGIPYAKAIMDGIDNSKTMVVLCSKNCFESDDVLNEIDQAHQLQKDLFPLRIDDTPLGREFGYYLARRQWIDATSIGLEDAFQQLADALGLESKEGKEDNRMVNALIRRILASSNDNDYKTALLIELGDFNNDRRRRRLDEARDYYSSALSLLSEIHKKNFEDDLDVADLYFKIAQIDQMLGGFTEAEQHYIEAVTRYSKSRTSSTRSRRYSRDEGVFDCHLKIAEIRSRLKKYELAEESCLEAKKCLLQLKRFSLSRKPRIFCELFADVLRKQGKDNEARLLYDEVLSLFRNGEIDKEDFSEMLHAFAQSNLKNDNLVSAEKYLKEASSLKEGDTSILLDLAKTYDSLGQLDKAAEVYEKCFLWTLKGNVLDKWNTNVEDVIRKVTLFMDRLKRYDTVDNLFQLAIAKYKVDNFEKGSSETGIGEIYEMYADWLFKQERYTDSLQYLKMCVKISQNPRISLRLNAKQSKILFLLGMVDEALDILVKEMESDQSYLNTDSVDVIGELYNLVEGFQTIHFDSAISAIKSFIIDVIVPKSSKDNSEQFETSLGWYLLLLKEYQYAEKPLLNAMALCRNDESLANAKNNLGRLYACTGRFEEAERLLNEAKTYNEKESENNNDALRGYAESLSYLGLLFMRKGNYQAAVIYLEKALEIYNKYSITSDRYGSDIKQTEKWLEEARAPR